MTQGAFLHRPGFLAGIHRILMTAAATGMKRGAAFRHSFLRLRLMTIMAIFRFSISLGCVVTSRAIHAVESGMHLVHKSYDAQLATLKINNFLSSRDLIEPHYGRTNQ